MALLDSNIGNLMMGLASYKRPGLLDSFVRQKQSEYERKRQAEEDLRRREMEDYKFGLLKDQQEEQKQISGLLGMPQVPGVTLPQEEVTRKIAQSMARMGDISNAVSLLNPPNKSEGFTLGPGQARYNERGELIASLDKIPDPIDAAKQQKERFDMEETLRGEFGKETKSFIDLNDAFGRIVASAEKPSPAGDMSLIYAYIKMLDPTTGIKEGEIALAGQAGSIPDRILAMYNNAVKGNGLSDSQRMDFVQRSKMLFDRASKQYEQRSGIYADLATRNNLNPENVIIDRNLFRKYAPEKPDDIFTGEFYNGFPIYQRPNGKKYAVGE